jgi:amidase
MGATITALQYHAAVETAQAWSRRMCAWWAEGNDVLVTPTMGELPPPLGHLASDVETTELMGRMGGFAPYTGPFNVTGQPAISLPLHWSAGGLPVGVQFVGAYGREDVLFRLAGQLEQARPWADRRPPVFAAAAA